MNTETVLTTCRMLYATHFVPMACLDANGTLLAQFCPYQGFAPVFDGIAKLLPARESPQLLPGVAGLYGVLRVQGSAVTVVAGPFLNKKLTDEVLDTLVHTYRLPWQQKEQLRQFLLELPQIPLNRFLSFIALLQYLLNGSELSITDFFNESLPTLTRDMGQKHTERILQEKPITHGTYSFEQQLLHYVSAGDEAGLSAFFDSAAKLQPFSEGKLADDRLRQSKNIFIGLVCMVGKVGAIRGNLDVEQTYQLIDVYTQECERCTSVRQVNELRYTAIMDFTHRVAEQQHPDAYSLEVYTALQYIKTHTNQPLTAADVVAYIGKSRSVFMQQFKQETGETIGRYIIKAKLQEAKLLLAYSHRSLADISSFLYFSSQSHFQNQFKKAFGITPLQYRKRRQK